MLPGSLPDKARDRGVTALLGPTNTGKTHLAIERMLGHPSGIIGLPLRLLAREVYQRIVERVGADAVALVTGEEKIKPDNARYWVATAEAMPRDRDVSFLAIDEIQLAADADRGHIFTDALLNRRGRAETLLIGAATMRPLVERLLPGANIVSRPRLSTLSFAGERKLTRLPPRSAIIAFSAEEVYAIAELLRRQRGGAAVVLGALSPRTRNAQVALYQNGDVDCIVATDAIGMGLNLDIDHVAFSGDRKFDGRRHRRLIPAEFGQIAGRAGRHLRDGSFGTSGRCPPFEPELVEALEEHRFAPVEVINWRNPALSFASLAALSASLGVLPDTPGLARAPTAEDETTFDIAAGRPDIRDLASSRDGVRRLWEACQLPDYRKVAPHHHAELVATLYGFMMRARHIPTDWFAREIATCDRMEGGIDTLSARLAQIRTWTFCSNQNDWLADPGHWQGLTRAIEDKLSDALHEKLAQRFVDRRTSVLMRRLRENAMLEALVMSNGDVLVEGQHIGHLQGFRFTSDPQATGPEAKALQAAAAKALATEIEARALRLQAAPDDAFALALDGTLRWVGEPVGRIQAGDKILEPRVLLLADDQLAAGSREGVEARLALWIKAHVERLLGLLLPLERGDGLEGIVRGIAFQLAEHLGILDRASVAHEIKNLDQTARGEMRKLGVRFGAHHIYLPNLMKPAARALAAQLWMLKQGSIDRQGLDEITHLASSGRTSIPVDAKLDKALYRAAGYRVSGARAIRVDILERLADIIRPAIAFRPGITQGEPPPGAYAGDGFTATVAMTSLVGCSGEEFGSILKSLGYRMEMRPAPEKPAPEAQIAEAQVAEATEGGAAAAPGTAPAAAEPPAEASLEQAEAAPATETAEGVEASDSAQHEAPAMPEALETDAGETAAQGATDAASEAAPQASEAEPAAIAEEAASESAEPVAQDAAAEAADPAGQAAAAQDTAEQAPATEEPAMIEVWRPGRFERPERRPNRTDGAGPRRNDQHGERRGRRPQQGGGAGAPRDGGAPQQGQHNDGQRNEGQRNEGRRDDGRRGGRQRFPDRPRRDDERRGERPNQQPRPPRQERQPDPNSPFAKLLELKQRMEAEKNKP